MVPGELSTVMPWRAARPERGLTWPSVPAGNATLEKGPGHVPGSELPGEDTGRKNCVITAHRDSNFRHLGWLRKGHRLSLETPAGKMLDYRVVSREIVKPDAVRVEGF